MTANRTFAMLKPDSIENNNIGNILGMIEAKGFKISGMKLKQLSNTEAQEFYAIHKDRPFFGELIEYVTRGSVVTLCLEKENAVADFRKLIGATNPKEAEEGTIRKLYADSISENAIHGSDSNENAAIEIALHFKKEELL